MTHVEREVVESDGEGVEIHTGWTVVSVSGDRIGQVEDVYPDHIIVAKGFLFPSRWRVPASAISRIENDWVQLSATRQQVEAQEWDQMTSEGTTEFVDDVAFDGSSHAPQVMRHDVPDSYPIETRLSLGEIRAHRQPYDSISDGVTMSGFADIEISIPVYGEQAVVRTTPVVRETAVITRTLRERTQRVTDTVRREEIVINGDVSMIHDDQTRPLAI